MMQAEGEMEAKVEVPKEFVCPITMEIMKEPFIMPDGQTYEREAIRKALMVNPVSPLTKMPMKFEDGKINYALKSLIDDFLKKNPSVDPTQKVEDVERKKQAPSTVDIEDMNANYFIDPENENMACVNVRVKPKAPSERSPVLLIAMIDVSGSMCQDTCETVKGMEDLSFSRMQLVKHSLNTIISTLGEGDMISLIKFEGRASMCLEPRLLDKTGKEEALKAVDELHDGGSTNIWDALRLGVKRATEYSGSIYSTHLLLFTDGEPNVNPPMGIIPSLMEILSEQKMEFTISTFAFGYNVDSKLMEGIAKIGNGVYGYCPDCTMVGTVFVNFMANILTTIAPTVEIKVDNPKLQTKYNIGGIYQDVYRNHLFKVPMEYVEDTTIEITIKKTGQNFDIPLGKLITPTDPEYTQMLDQYYRYKLIELVGNNVAGKDLKHAQEEVQELFDKISALPQKTQFLEDLLIDLVNDDENHGQVKKAFDESFFKKWGADYLYSFTRDHILEICGNFKDQSLKHYGGQTFETERKKANKLFIELEPPARPVTPPSMYGGYHHYNGNTMPMGMNMRTMVTSAHTHRFMDMMSGCFSGEGKVALKEGTKLVKELVKGDVLVNGAVVRCLVITKIGEKRNVVELNGEFFTPYHPVFHEGAWVFPADIKAAQEEYIDKWYNLVLDNGSSVVINDVEAITLGHGRTKGVLAHPYFGTEKVIDALRKYSGFELGCIEVGEPTTSRDPKTGLVCSYY